MADLFLFEFKRYEDVRCTFMVFDHHHSLIISINSFTKVNVLS